MTITIEEVEQSAWVDVEVDLINCPEGMRYTYRQEDFRARVTGPASAVEKLSESGVSAVVDLSGLAEGQYALPITIDEQIYPGITFELEPASVRVTLESVSVAE